MKTFNRLYRQRGVILIRYWHSFWMLLLGSVLWKCF